jgi:hypothetical protein
MPILVASIAMFAFTAHAQVVFSPAKVISNPSDNSFADQIAIDSKGNINVVWLERTSPTYPYSQIVFFSRSSDGGVTFSSPVSISHAGSSAGFARVAVAPNGSIYVLWSDNSLGYYAEFFSRSTDGGTTFSAPQQLSNAGGNVLIGKMIVGSSGNIDVSWNENSPSYYAVFFSHSTDGGTNFSSPINVSNNPLGSYTSDMSVDSSGNIYLAWVAQSAFVFNGVTYQGNALFFSGSVDGGTTFSSPTHISGFNGPNAQFFGFQVAADSMNNISVLWQLQTYSPVDLWYSYSTDSGATFKSAELQPGFEFPPNPHMALDSLGGANLVWQVSGGNGSASVRYARDAGGVPTTGASWSVMGNTPNPQLAVDSANNIDLFFAGNFTRSSDGGATFSALQNAPGGPDAIVTDASGNMYFTWSGYNSSTGNTNIYFSRSVGLSSVALSLSALTGGSSSTGMVTLSGPAPTGGAVVSLLSSNPSASVPANVTIPAGTTSTTFTVTTGSVAASTTAVISAVFSGVTQTASVTIAPPVLTSLTLNPSSVTGGSSSTGTVTLSGPAPAGGAVVTLSSSNSSFATVPSSVTVSPGFINATFTLNTRPLLCSNNATISGSFNSATLAANLAVSQIAPVPQQACAIVGPHGPRHVGSFR